MIIYHKIVTIIIKNNSIKLIRIHILKYIIKILIIKNNHLFKVSSINLNINSHNHKTIPKINTKKIINIKKIHTQISFTILIHIEIKIYLLKMYLLKKPIIRDTHWKKILRSIIWIDILCQKIKKVLTTNHQVDFTMV